MEYKTICLVFLFYATAAKALNCTTCTQDFYEGESTANSDCYDNATAVSSQQCSGDDYCQTQIGLYDGLVAFIRRGCKSPMSDQDTSTDYMPSHDQCYILSNFRPNTERTTCYLSCNRTDNCNTQAATSLEPCPSNCSVALGQGYCDYISQTCKCNSDWTGSNCDERDATTTTPYRKCLQCNGDTDQNCETGNGIIATQCPESISTHRYCASTKTNLLNRDGTVERTIVTRGCSDEYDTNRCEFSDPADTKLSAYREYTCVTSCDTDGCNIDKDEDFNSSNEEKSLYCVQCSDLTGSGSCNSPSSRQLCPSSSTHCKSTVKYLISNSEALVPDYELISVVRECAGAAVTAQCTSSTTTTTSEVQAVTCEETCQSDGCNYRWPARPLCSTCNISTPSLENDPCVNTPPIPTRCSYPYEKYCVILETNKGNVKGYPETFTRRCSNVDIGSRCADDTLYGQTIQNCNKTCSTDGCNLGGGSSILHPGLLIVVLPTALTYIMKFL